MKFNYDVAKKLAPKANLIYSQGLVDYVDPTFEKLGLTQEQVDGLQKLWIRLAAYLFNPLSYSWKDRIIQALFLLGFFKSARPHDIE